MLSFKQFLLEVKFFSTIGRKIDQSLTKTAKQIRGKSGNKPVQRPNPFLDARIKRLQQQKAAISRGISPQMNRIKLLNKQIQDINKKKKKTIF